MGENTGAMYLIIAMIAVLGAALLFTGSTSIPAETFFQGVS